MNLEGRLSLTTRHCPEVLTAEELKGLLSRTATPRAYIGFEPSGRLTIGQLVTARKMRDLQEAGFELTVFLADWHAWINDKLGGSLERIQATGRYMQSAFTALGVDPGRAKYRWGSELAGRSEYWARVVRVAKATSLARTKRAMTILGRSEAESQLDTAKLFYPAMQAADIFELPVDLAYAGIDQRRAHVLAREVAHAQGWPTPVAIHTPLISSLRGGGRMDPEGGTFGQKMSKSDPSNSISIPMDPKEVERRVAQAFCPAKVAEGNPVVEIARWILLPWEGRIRLERDAKHGGAREFTSEAEFLRDWTEGNVHPLDLKNAVASALGRILEPCSAYFRSHPNEIPEGL